MTFRKDSLLFREHQIGFFAFAILCLVCIPILKIFNISEDTLAEVILSLCFFLGFLLFGVLAMISSKQHNEFVTVNESGISCHKAGKLLWQYEWNEILALKRSQRYKLPSIEIVVQSPCIGLDSCREIENARCSGDYFQLSRAAKEAIERYYKSRENALIL